MITIKSFKKSKSSKGNTQVNNNSNGGGGFYTTIIEPHQLWGNTFDGTQDVNGNIYSPNIYNSGEIRTNRISGQTAHFGQLTVTGQTTLDGNTTTKTIVPKTTDNYDLGSLTDWWLNLYARNIKCSNLDVNGFAHFKELVIDKVSATNGELVISPANFHVDKILGYPNVEEHEDGWDTAYDLIMSQTGVIELPEQIYLCKLGQLRYDPTTGQELKEQLRVGDYLYCSSFNIGEGTHSNVSNQYYRTIVVDCGKTTQDGQEYLYATVIRYYTDENENDIWLPNCGSVTPKEGDDLVMLGCSESLDNRQSAIIISSVNGIDSSVVPPSITQYANINKISVPISNYKITSLSPNGNTFKGNFITQNGHTVEELINNMNSPVYLHTAYSIDLNGNGFTKTPQSGQTYDYMGMCINGNPSDSNLVFADYEWSFINQNSVQYKLIPIQNKVDFVLRYDSATDTITDELVVYLCCDVIKTTPQGAVVPDQNENIRVEAKYGNAESQKVQLGTLGDNRYVYVDVIQNFSQSNYRNLFKNVTVDLFLNGSNVDSYQVQMNANPQSILSVSNSIQARVQDVEGNYSTLSMRADSIETNVTNLSGQTSTFRQTYDQFVLSLYDGLSRTGIDITNHNINLTADNFLVKNNNNVNTLYVNSQGLVESRTGFMTNPKTGNENTFYPTFYAISINRFANDPLAYTFGLSGYDKAVNGSPRLSNEADYTDSVWTDWLKFQAPEHNVTSSVKTRIPEMNIECHDFTFQGSSNIQNYGAVSGRFRTKISPKDGIACVWNNSGTPILGQTKDINGNDASGIVGWTGGTEKLLAFGPAGVVVKDGTYEIVIGWNNTIDEWITSHGTQWNAIPVGSMIRVKTYASDRFSTLICKERD